MSTTWKTNTLISNIWATSGANYTTILHLLLDYSNPMPILKYELVHTVSQNQTILGFLWQKQITMCLFWLQVLSHLALTETSVPTKRFKYLQNNDNRCMCIWNLWTFRRQRNDQDQDLHILENMSSLSAWFFIIHFEINCWYYTFGLSKFLYDRCPKSIYM